MSKKNHEEESSGSPRSGEPLEAPRTVIRGERSEFTHQELERIFRDEMAKRPTTVDEEFPWDHIDPATGERIVFVPNLKRGTGLVKILVPKNGVLPLSALTDFLNLTFLMEEGFEVNDIAVPLMTILGEKFAPVKDRKRGLHGYKQSFTLGESGALLAVGGQAGTGFLSFSGQACNHIENWHVLHDFLSTLPGARITRWDGAVDDFIGRFGVDDAVEMYKHGWFNTGGNKPSCRQVGDWLEPDGRGRTFYVGMRQNGKMLRVYEKGMQCGRRHHPWVRWEVEFRNKDREIPWDVLLTPGPYLVGAYPRALHWVGEEVGRIKTLKYQYNLTLDALADHAKRSYGKCVNGLLEIYDGDHRAVIERLIEEGKPRRVIHLRGWDTQPKKKKKGRQ